jgi:formylglycine-generating enzyme required for sulfatase activity
MVIIPGGKFTMGSDDPRFKLWQPAHTVTLDTFCLDTFEVTQAAYRACVAEGACARPGPISFSKVGGETDAAHEKLLSAYGELCTFDNAQQGRHPINCVSWPLADAYCQSRGKRLPTEAEWEYAARGAEGRTHPWGDEPGDALHLNGCGSECTAWEREHRLSPSPRLFEASDEWPGTAPVGSFPKGMTKQGVYDLAGNVWEWTQDWFETYKADEVVNPKGARAGARKAIRGGGFNSGMQMWLDPAFRYHQMATASSPAIGFRCAAGL